MKNIVLLTLALVSLGAWADSDKECKHPSPTYKNLCLDQAYKDKKRMGIEDQDITKEKRIAEEFDKIFDDKTQTWIKKEK